jgi:hypothetical protein
MGAQSRTMASVVSDKRIGFDQMKMPGEELPYIWLNLNPLGNIFFPSIN